MRIVLRRLLALLRPPEPARVVVPPTLQEEVAAGAERFRALLVAEGLSTDAAGADALLERRRPDHPDRVPEELLSDAAGFLGEEVRRTPAGGIWHEHPRLGIVLGGLAGVPWGKLLPLPVVERKWRRGAAFRLQDFLASLDRRLVAEKAKAATEDPAGFEEAAVRGSLAALPPDEAVAAQVRLLADFWRARYRTELPLSLVGVRELDGFLRSHSFVNFLPDAVPLRAGLYVGEVGRALFGGTWVTDAAEPERCALRHPELDFYPVGRVLRMLTEFPDGDPLDEYLRLIPSARAELRKQGDPLPNPPA